MYSPTTPLGRQTGYQILMGIGYGYTQQMRQAALSSICAADENYDVIAAYRARTALEGVWGYHAHFSIFVPLLEPGPGTAMASSSDGGDSSAVLETIQDKVNQLESPIIAFMGQSNVSITATRYRRKKDQDGENCCCGRESRRIASSNSLGSMHTDNKRMTYSEAAHWPTILEGKRFTQDPGLLLGPCGHATKPEILAAIPSRTVVNRLIFQYLQRLSIIQGAGTLNGRYLCRTDPTVNLSFKHFGKRSFNAYGWENPSMPSLHSQNVTTLSPSGFGLPRMIHAFQFDTAEPRNLVDSYFDTNIKDLPAARPDTEQTTVQYLVTKTRLKAMYFVKRLN
ncbi:hypothetical protein TSTA_015220 [Talaromyces stipitatus ATCC 10500]|uniref:Uncharacterized protein n=1 Tax=Talaromyces stipitatus (strain ATCC 10500 / CBS 375.48 / QM 6759 / NRRL 1006) TaxID=441959 RepID=B8MHV4_TALSN|nr:uncharacterized protein TSTA_015220 [Talaromyces stipitatus ATCC 10500]EED16434.1 hypothetical protein TSTA_015220 [Talaromyces stipitatus ATCC 10500]